MPFLFENIFIFRESPWITQSLFGQLKQGLAITLNIWFSQLSSGSGFGQLLVQYSIIPCGIPFCFYIYIYFYLSKGM